MTTVYFVRHAQSDYSIHDDLTRPLSKKGLDNCPLVIEFLKDKGIDVVLSSPYKRAVDTIAGFAKTVKLPVQTVDGFRERKIDSGWIEDFKAFSKRQWVDFSYKLSDGECLAEVQERNIAALNEVLTIYKGKNIVVGTHGTALSTIINYYDKTYGFDDFMVMVNIMPWIVKMDFDSDGCVGMEKIDLFQLDRKPDYEQCKVCVTDLGALKAYRFVVIFARYQDSWRDNAERPAPAKEKAGKDDR